MKKVDIMNITQQTGAETYRVGSIRTHRGDHASFPRPLIRESDDRIIAIVDCEPGAWTIGTLTAAEAVARFGVRLPDADATTDRDGIPYEIEGVR